MAAVEQAQAAQAAANAGLLRDLGRFTLRLADRLRQIERRRAA